MKTVLKILKWLGILIAVVLIVFVVFVYSNADRYYDAPYPDIKASADSATLARGKYLVYGPAHCAHCHAPVSAIARVETGEEVPLSGGSIFELPVGKVYTPNISPDPETGIGLYSDEEIARALRYGVKKDGHALLDFMPFYDLSDRDLTAIITFLRATQPVKNKVQPNSWNFLGKMVSALELIKPMGDGDVPPAPPIDSTAEYGKYLTTSVANCKGCHTKRDLMTGGWIGPEFAGQFEMEMIDAQGRIIKGQHLVSQNLTPDPETGRITNWTKETFIKRFREGRIIPGSPMPWGPFSRMSDLELTAIYKFLKTLKPVHSDTPVGIQKGDPQG